VSGSASEKSNPFGLAAGWTIVLFVGPACKAGSALENTVLRGSWLSQFQENRTTVFHLELLE
jgi:hypothetical protein